jgi:hypothetical protein
MTNDPLAALAVRRICADLEAGPVQVGVARGQWQIGEFEYPVLMVRIAASPMTYARGWVDLRVDITSYPDQAPTICPWDVSVIAPLAADNRPNGGRASMVFRSDWESGRALYHPCDRVAIAGHGDWPREHGDDMWDPDAGIAKVLRLLHTILNEADHATAVASG